ncbi:MAG: DUF6544 family protein [Saprospiraceae bacterium]
MKFLFLTLLVLHGFIHLMGFSKAFGLAEIKELQLPISRMAGVFWALSFAGFILTSVLYFQERNFWWLAAFVSVAISQFLIFYTWQDAKYGSLANGIILLVALSAMFAFLFEKSFKEDVIAIENKMATLCSEPIPLDKARIEKLPSEIQDYLLVSQSMDKPVPLSVHAFLEGKMRSKNSDWFDFTAEQYNFHPLSARLFFMKGKLRNIPFSGYHKYLDGKASMDIRLLGIFPISKASGADMFQAETVTFFNELCLFMPGALADENIRWDKGENEGELTGYFENENTRVSARLFFNENGELVNFISEDRIEVNSNQKLPFLTPVTSYKNFNGLRLMSEGEAIWQYDDGPFAYGKIKLKKLETRY